MNHSEKRNYASRSQIATLQLFDSVVFLSDYVMLFNQFAFVSKQAYQIMVRKYLFGDQF